MIRPLLSLSLFIAGFGYESLAFAEDQPTAESVTIINPQNNPRFRKFLDDALLDIMSTDVGRALCAHVLGGKLELIEKHIGVSTPTAKAIKNRCGSRPAKQITYIHPSNEEDLIKFSDSISTEKREYFFVFNLNKPWPMDSWTDPIGNKTYLIFQKDWLEAAQKSTNAETNQKLSILLYQMLAHELAIYFDPKHFPGGTDWDRLGLAFSTQWPQPPEQLEKIYSALMNPMIASALAFFRAFQIERMIMTELAAKQGFALPSEYFNPSFSCMNQCLQDSIKKMALRFSEQSATLLALSPQYRNRLLVKQSHFSSNGLEEELRIAVEEWPKIFFEQFDIKDVANPWVMLLPVATTKQNALQNRVSNFISKVLFPSDYDLLTKERLYENLVPVPLLDFMSRPLLSGYNIRLSTGPRIRIRGGDIK